MKDSKYFISVFIAITTVIFVGFFATIFFYDPIKIFHKPWVYKGYFHPNMRIQAAGIINNVDFDSIIIGTSMLENTSADEASKLLGGHFVNISLSGSDFYERKIVLEDAFRHKRIKTIIYSLDSFAFLEQRVENPHYNLSKWAYLYDRNPLNDFQFYLNTKFLNCIFMAKDKHFCMGLKLTLDRPNAWFSNPRYKIRFGGIENWFKAQSDVQVKEAFSNILTRIEKKNIFDKKNQMKKSKMTMQYLNDTLLKLAKKYEDTNFIFIFPPYSRIQFALDAQYNKSDFFIYKNAIKYLVKQSKIYKNIHIYAWGNDSFVDDIANYKDLHHYSEKINSYMLTAVREQKGLLTEQNVDDYLKKFEKKCINYDLLEISNKIKLFLASKNKKEVILRHNIEGK
jgi:hypothetical protein